MPEANVETGIDGLLTYVYMHGETEVSVITSALKIEESTIIGWATILEKANRIKIVNKSGKMFIAPA